MSTLQLLSDLLARPIQPVESTADLDSLPGWDSLKMVRLVLQLEEGLGRQLSEDELEGLQTYGDVARLVGES